MSESFVRDIGRRFNGWMEQKYIESRPGLILRAFEKATLRTLSTNDGFGGFVFPIEELLIYIHGDIDNLMGLARKKRSIIFRKNGTESTIIAVPFQSSSEFVERSASTKRKQYYLEKWWNAQLTQDDSIEVVFNAGDKVNQTHETNGIGWPSHLRP